MLSSELPWHPQERGEAIWGLVALVTGKPTALSPRCGTAAGGEKITGAPEGNALRPAVVAVCIFQGSFYSLLQSFKLKVV